MTTEHRLDALLDAWAEDRRMDADDADAVLRSILSEPRDALAASWWSGLSAQVTSAVLLATSPPGSQQMVAA